MTTGDSSDDGRPANQPGAISAFDHLREIAEASGDWIWSCDEEGRITWSSPAVHSLLGRTAAEVVASSLFEHVPTEDRAESRRYFESYVTRRQGWKNLLRRMLHRTGEERFVESTAIPVMDDSGRLVGYRGLDRDITERTLFEQRLRHQAFHDSLTGLANRSLFVERLDRVIRRITTDGEGAHLSVFFLDVDHFKIINDTLGHRHGDEILRAVAQRLAHAVPDSHNVSRVGGDEFVFFIENMDATDAVAFGEQLLGFISAPHAREQNHFLSASIGIARYPHDAVTTEELIRHADNAMYRAKELGRNMVQLFSPSMSDRYRNRLAFEGSLRLALEREEFVVQYQPVYEGTSHALVGVEALLRWQHPERGLLLPEEFIQVAEETRLIVPIGEWVLRRACEDHQRWVAAGFKGLRMGVNLSARQFQHGDLVGTVERVLAETGMSAQDLELEITESAAMQNADLTLRTLYALNRMGVSIAVDDFGTGYSSLLYLTRFPINTVKVDRTFVRDVATDQGDAAVVAAVVALARSLNLRTVAEGVETEEQMAFLRLHSCDEVQGFLYSPPMSSAEILEILGRGPSVG